MMRPFTILAAVIAGFSLNYFFGTLSGKGTTFFFAVLTGLVLGFLQSGGQVLNQSLLVEMEIDKVNKKDYRPTLRGKVTFEEGKIFAFFLFLAGVSLAFMLHSGFGLFAVLITVFAVTYSAPPFRVKEKFLLNNIHQGIARGFLPAVLVASAYGYGIHALFFGMVIAMWVSVFQTTKDFADVVGDRKFNVKTLPVVLGPKKTLKVMGLAESLPFLALVCLIWLKLFPINFLWLLLLAFPSVGILVCLNKGFVAKKFENNWGWLIFYLCLALWYILPALLV